MVNFSDDSDPISILAAQIPDEPTSLENVASLTTSSSIGLSWVAPVFDGGSAVVDYAIWYDNAEPGSTFILLASGLTLTNF